VAHESEALYIETGPVDNGKRFMLTTGESGLTIQIIVDPHTYLPTDDTVFSPEAIERAIDLLESILDLKSITDGGAMPQG